VSSGGMLTQKLDPVDFNSEKMSKFDGTMVYAQNKRQQVKKKFNLPKISIIYRISLLLKGRIG